MNWGSTAFSTLIQEPIAYGHGTATTTLRERLNTQAENALNNPVAWQAAESVIGSSVYQMQYCATRRDLSGAGGPIGYCRLHQPSPA